MRRTDYNYTTLSEGQYTAILNAGSMGRTSPMHGPNNYSDFMAASQGINCDGRVLLAGLQFESHFGCDPGGADVAAVNNLSGIIYAQQSYAYRSDVLRPLNERPNDPEGNRDSSHYAGFYTLGDFYREFARTMTNIYVGPYFNTGDLVMAWAVYVGGPGNPNMVSGQARVDQWQYFLATYPPEGDGAVTNDVYGEDMVTMFATQIGRPRSGDYDAHNGDHAWAYWCEAGIESTGRNLGLTVAAQSSAVSAGRWAQARGILHTDDAPEHGAVIVLDTRFYNPDGHTGVWNAERQQLLGTLTDGNGVGYRSWGPGTNGYMGWYRLPGVVGVRREGTTLPPPHNWLEQPDNPYTGFDGRKIGIGGGFHRYYTSVGIGIEPLTVLGYAMENEQQAIVKDRDGNEQQRTVQHFERGWVQYCPENAFPWDVILTPLSSVVTVIV